MLEVRGLCVTRGKNTILDGIDWRVERGQHWVILGANGSGKTSLLSALTAYLTPSAGSVEVLGAAYGRADWRELRQHVGLVSSSIRQMIGDDATALEVVVSGKEATLNFWGRLSAADRARGLTLLRRVGGRQADGTTLGGVEPGRASAGAHRAGADGQPATSDPR